MSTFKNMSLKLPYNMNREEKLVVETTNIDWIDSPASNVKRRPLEREKEESGQVTSVVEYKPGAKFKEHTHPMGEEIFVLSGEFADEDGRYPAGTYIRNPPGSAHSPFSEKGCVLFVKLNQFLPSDSKRFVINSKKLDWSPGHGTLMVKPLHSFEGRALLFCGPVEQSFKSTGTGVVKRSLCCQVHFKMNMQTTRSTPGSEAHTCPSTIHLVKKAVLS